MKMEGVCQWFSLVFFLENLYLLIFQQRTSTSHVINFFFSIRGLLIKQLVTGDDPAAAGWEFPLPLSSSAFFVSQTSLAPMKVRGRLPIAKLIYKSVIWLVKQALSGEWVVRTC